MFFRTYLSKDNTIYSNDKVNVGQNPIGELYFNSNKLSECNTYSRHLIHFDVDHLREMYECCKLGDLSNVRHILTLYPAPNTCDKPIGRDLDVLIYKLCQDFSEGCGYDLNSSNRCSTSIYNTTSNDSVYSIAASNWFESSYCNDWCELGSITFSRITARINESELPSSCIPEFEKVYYDELPLSNHVSGTTMLLSGLSTDYFPTGLENVGDCEVVCETTYREVENINVSETEVCELTPRTICIEVPMSGTSQTEFTGSTIEMVVNSDLDYYAEYEIDSSSEIVGMDHVDCANYCGLQFDLTDCVNEMITGDTPNHGFGISLHPKHEMYGKGEFAVSFYNRNTMSFFKPHLDTICEDPIKDDRNCFYLDCPQNLYLYTSKKLDRNPTINIYDSDGCFCFSAETVCADDCIYKAEIELTGYTDECGIFKDEWTDIVVDGKRKADVINRFAIYDDFESVTNGFSNKLLNYNLSISGIKHKETITGGELRRIFVNLQKPISDCFSDNEIPDKIEYRIYVKEGLSQLDVICWTETNYTNCEYWFDLDTTWMLGTCYYIDVRVSGNKQVRVNSDEISFDITQSPNICLGC